MDTEKIEPVGFATRTRIVAVVGGLGIVAILVALAFVFATSSGAQQVAESARSLHEANAAAGSAALSRAALAQATVFGIDNELGVASDEALDIALAAATATLEDVEHGQMSWHQVAQRISSHLISTSSRASVAG